MADRDRRKPLCDSTLWCRPRTCDPQILARRQKNRPSFGRKGNGFKFNVHPYTIGNSSLPSNTEDEIRLQTSFEREFDRILTDISKATNEKEKHARLEAVLQEYGVILHVDESGIPTIIRVSSYVE